MAQVQSISPSLWFTADGLCECGDLLFGFVW